ncbi:serine hydrolase domain-containing protein [Pedobacter psychroterrae]|uniref:Class A beta-lactamase-related serine hydrolase n=1 Tax=Pedobacter psychroterrae TaxID=2530453 RepID=A0A4R0NKQ1_9SPHI|nr:serine hydrolase domain-containing protein [Pedobacter psychroterrae]TCD00458.1 class A beta-lactamase-related serine hydrolase [Pedobacter psychroterrae]
MCNKNLLLCLLLNLTVGYAAIAQHLSTTITAGTPEVAGFSAQRLTKLDNAMKEWTDKGWMNGAVALVIRNGKIAYYNGVGYNDIEAKQKMPKEGIFRIASQTKAITSVAIMMLFDDGKLLLNDRVSKFIPSFSKPTVLDKFEAKDTTYTTLPAAREITIKDLLTHTSGLGYAQIGSPEANAIYAKSNITAGLGVKEGTLLEAMTRLGKLPLMHQPGQRWTYGLNTDLLGCIVEVVSGMSLDQFFKTRIFQPMGMNSTYFSVPESKSDQLVNMYTEDQQGKLIKGGNKIFGTPTASNYPLIGSTYYSGGGGLSAPIMDYAIFLQMLLNGGEYNGVRLLGRNTVRMMTMNQIGDLSLGDDKFGLGFGIVTEKGSANTPAQAGTFSWGGAFSTSYWVDPKEKMVLLFYRQLQSSSHGNVTERFRALTYQALN